MACLEMYNSDKHNKGHQYNSSSPRISFSNDFVQIKPENSRNVLVGSEGPQASSDFEFSVTNYSMTTADELFFKGKLLPFKGKTLREELLVEEEGPDDDDLTLRPPLWSSSSSSSSSKGRWKGLLGLKRTHIGSKKSEKTNQESFGDNTKKPSQDALSEGGTNCRDTDVRR